MGYKLSLWFSLSKRKQASAHTGSLKTGSLIFPYIIPPTAILYCKNSCNTKTKRPVQVWNYWDLTCSTEPRHVFPAGFWEKSNVTIAQVSLGRNSGLCFFSCCHTKAELGWLCGVCARSPVISSIFLFSFSHHCTLKKKIYLGPEKKKNCWGPHVMMTHEREACWGIDYLFKACFCTFTS